MARKLLVVTTTQVDEERLRERVRAHAGDDADVKVVAPASDVSPLQWLVSDEDRARAEAATAAERARGALEPEARVEESEVGDPDPLQAIEDALRTFPADEVVLVTRPDERASWLERTPEEEGIGRFGLPVTRLVADGDERAGP